MSSEGAHRARITLGGTDADHVAHIKGVHHEQEDHTLKQRLEAVAKHEAEGEQHAPKCNPYMLEAHLCEPACQHV